MSFVKRFFVPVIFLFAFLTLVACGGQSDVPAPTATVVVDNSVSEPVEEQVLEAEPTAVLEHLPVIIEDDPISAASPRVSATPVVTPALVATAVPTDTVVTLVKPEMPEFVKNAGPDCVNAQANEYSYYLGQSNTDFTSRAYRPALDLIHDTIWFYRSAESGLMSYYVWMGEQLDAFPAGDYYLIVRYYDSSINKNNSCTPSQYMAWAEQHLQDVIDFAADFEAWYERSLEPAEETAIAESTPYATSEAVQCEFNDGNPNAFILASQTPHQMNFVVTEPSWGKVTITSSDQEIVVEANTTEVDGCMRLGFTVPNHSGPMNLLVTAENGTVLSNHNFWADHAQLGPDGHSFDAP